MVVRFTHSNDLIECITYCINKSILSSLADGFVLCPVIFVLLDYKRLHFSGLHTGRMPAHVYGEYNISLPVFLLLQ